jgi:hypothetical protein
VQAKARDRECVRELHEMELRTKRNETSPTSPVARDVNSTGDDGGSGSGDNHDDNDNGEGKTKYGSKQRVTSRSRVK